MKGLVNTSTQALSLFEHPIVHCTTKCSYPSCILDFFLLSCNKHLKQDISLGNINLKENIASPYISVDVSKTKLFNDTK